MSQALIILPIVVRNKSVLVTSVLIQGPQQREFHMEIPQAKQAGVGASRENFTWKFYKTIILVPHPSLISFNNTFKCLCDMIGK